MIKKLSIFFSFLFSLSLCGQINYEIDSLDSRLAGLKDDSTKVFVLNRLGALSKTNNDLVKALNYSLMAKNLAEKINFRKGAADAAIQLARICNVQGNYVLALDNCLKSLKIREELGDENSAIACMTVMANIYISQKNYPKSLEWFLKQLQLAQKLNDQMLESNSMTSVGIAYWYQKEYTKSLEYYFKALRIKSALKDSIGVWYLLFDIGTSYSELGQSYLALEYEKQALKLAIQTTNRKQAIGYTYIGIGEIYCKQNDFEKAKENYLKGVSIYEEVGDKIDLPDAYYELGRVYEKTNEPEKAIACFEKQLELAKQENLKENIQLAYSEMSAIYEKKEDYKKAFRYYKLGSTIRDSVFNFSTSKQISDMQSEYDMEIKKNEIELLEKNNQVNKLAIVILLIGIISILTMWWGIYQRNKFKHKEAMQTERLQHQKEQLNAILETQEIERKRIAKDLHDSVGQSLAGLKLGWKSIYNEIQQINPALVEKLNVTTKVLDDTANEIRLISHQMMPRTLHSEGLIPAIEDMLTSTFRSTDIMVEFFHLDENERYNEQIEINLYRICQEMINNIVKHSNARSVTISFHKNKTGIVLVIDDDGKGFNFEEKASKGHGLLNIQTRIEAIKGSIRYEKGVESGVSTIILVPLP